MAFYNAHTIGQNRSHDAFPRLKLRDFARKYPYFAFLSYRRLVGVFCVPCNAGKKFLSVFPVFV